MSRVYWLLGIVVAAAAAYYITLNSSTEEESLLVYTSRQGHLIKPLLDLYESQTGQKVDWVSGDAPVLIERLKKEGASSGVDLFITVDAGNLWQAASLDLLESVDSETLEARVPEHLKDSEDRWFGLSVRARTLVYDSSSVDPSQLSTYEDLADPKWKGKLCLRTSKKVYTQSLVAMLIDHHGEEKVEEIVKGWMANLAQPVYSSDTHIVEAIEKGDCEVGIVNSYYYGRYEAEHPNTKVKIFWPGQRSYGVHVNVSGAGVVKTSEQKDQALHLLEWLTSDDAQKILSDSNREYPVVNSIEIDPLMSAWGEFQHDTTPLETAGKRQSEAIKLMDRVGYN